MLRSSQTDGKESLPKQQQHVTSSLLSHCCPINHLVPIAGQEVCVNTQMSLDGEEFLQISELGKVRPQCQWDVEP